MEMAVSSLNVSTRLELGNPKSVIFLVHGVGPQDPEDIALSAWEGFSRCNKRWDYKLNIATEAPGKFPQLSGAFLSTVKGVDDPYGYGWP